MAWNEQYARILEQMKKNSTTSTSISGADTKNDEPDFTRSFLAKQQKPFMIFLKSSKDIINNIPALL